MERGQVYYINFYPRSPCGERQSGLQPLMASLTFLSTLSLRRATAHYDNYNLHCVISIHALLAESDQTGQFVSIRGNYFYPRSPCGERRAWSASKLGGMSISIHALLAESDRRTANDLARLRTFLSTLSLRRATGDSSRPAARLGNFYPRSPCGERRAERA